VASSYSTEASFVSPVMKPVGKPDARNGPVRFDERGGETGQRYALAPAPLLDSTFDRHGSIIRAGRRYRPIIHQARSVDQCRLGVPVLQNL
jgi:hypothetical protein